MKFQLGDWTVQESANLLTRGAQSVRLEKRVMAVLVQLIEADGGVVSKDDLIDRVWNGAAVSDHSVANAISDLRRTLGDDRKNPRYIETIPKRGYRLIEAAQPLNANGSTQDQPNGVAPEAISTRFRVASIATAFVLISAVIAFFMLRPAAPPRLYLTDIENAVSNAEYDLAAHAASEMLTVSLAGGDYRLVRWRTAFSTDNDINANAQDRIIAGRIINDAGQPVLTLDVIDPGDGASIWAEAYPIKGENFAALASAISEDLRAPLGLGAPPPAYASEDPSIVEAYWLARHLWSLRQHPAIREAREILEGITVKAPQFAPAHAALADIYAHKTAEELALDRPETYPLAEEHLSRALALDPNLPEAFITQAFLSFFRDQDPKAAIGQINKAIAARPADALAWQTKGMIASASGDARTSLRAIERARELDPLSAGILWDRVWFLYVAGRQEDAVAAIADARLMAPPVHVYEGLVHLARGDDEAAFASWLERAAARGLPTERAREIRALADANGARAGLEALAYEAARPEGYSEVPIPHAALLTALDQNDRAVTVLLNGAPREKSWWWSWYDVMPGLAALRGDPCLAAVTDPQRAADG